MKVFNSRCEVDVKIKFYFDLYDIGGDGKISQRDLKKYFSTINTKDETDATLPDPAMDDYNIEEYIDPMITIIFKELVSNNKHGYIDFTDFKTLMWNTNVDKTCVIYLEEE